MINNEKLTFSDDLKSRWVIRRDECGDEYIALNGPKALGKGGLDHIYMIDRERAGYWLTSKKLNYSIQSLQVKLPGLVVEQQGEDEATVSFPIDQLDRLCELAGARKRPNLSEERIERLRQTMSALRMKKSLKDSGEKGPKINEREQGGI